MLPIVAIGGSVVIMLSLVAYQTPSYKAKREKETELKNLQKLIDQKTIELFNLRDRVENNKIDNTFNMTYLELEVLEIYENSNIRLPVEILEDLHLQKLEDYADIFKFIESQRKYWKLENSKVPFRKKEK